MVQNGPYILLTYDVYYISNISHITYVSSKMRGVHTAFTKCLKVLPGPPPPPSTSIEGITLRLFSVQKGIIK